MRSYFLETEGKLVGGRRRRSFAKRYEDRVRQLARGALTHPLIRHGDTDPRPGRCGEDCRSYFRGGDSVHVLNRTHREQIAKAQSGNEAGRAGENGNTNPAEPPTKNRPRA